MENLNGRRLVEAGDLCERRNGNAADSTDFKRYTYTTINKILFVSRHI